MCYLVGNLCVLVNLVLDVFQVYFYVFFVVFRQQRVIGVEFFDEVVVVWYVRVCCNDVVERMFFRIVVGEMNFYGYVSIFYEWLYWGKVLLFLMFFVMFYDFFNDEIEESFGEFGIEFGFFCQVFELCDLQVFVCRVGWWKVVFSFEFVYGLCVFELFVQSIDEDCIQVVD